MKNNCCSIWLGVRPQVKELVLTATEQIPVILRGPYNEFLEGLDNVCPVCGHVFQESNEKPQESIRPSNPTKQRRDIVITPPKPCTICKGVGNLGHSSKGFLIGCNNCFGDGIEPLKKSVDEKAQEEAQIKANQDMITQQKKEATSDTKPSGMDKKT